MKMKHIEISSGKSKCSFIPACIQVHLEILLYDIQKNIENFPITSKENTCAKLNIQTKHLAAGGGGGRNPRTCRAKTLLPIITLHSLLFHLPLNYEHLGVANNSTGHNIMCHISKMCIERISIS